MEREAHAFYEFLVTFDAIAADAEKQEEIVAMVSKAPRLPANAAWLFNVHPATVARLLANAGMETLRVKCNSETDSIARFSNFPSPSRCTAILSRSRLTYRSAAEGLSLAIKSPISTRSASA
jgi:hypothetical protein